MPSGCRIRRNDREPHISSVVRETKRTTIGAVPGSPIARPIAAATADQALTSLRAYGASRADSQPGPERSGRGGCLAGWALHTGSRRSGRSGKAECATRRRSFAKEGDDVDARRPSCSLHGAMSGCSPGHRWHILSLNGGSSPSKPALRLSLLPRLSHQGGLRADVSKRAP